MIGFFSGLLVFLLFVLYDLGQANLLPNIWSRLVRSFFLLGLQFWLVVQLFWCGRKVCRYCSGIVSILDFYFVRSYFWGF